MKKVENFTNCLNVLKKADFQRVHDDEIYKMGVIEQFNLTFELAWKALQAVLREHGAEPVKTGSPREILQLGYRHGFINDSTVWLVMLKRRNLVIHTYNEEEVDELLLLIHDSFLPAFDILEKTLRRKLQEAGDHWE